METISPVYARLVLRELEQRQIDPAPLFAGRDLDRATLLRGGDIALDDFLHILETGQALAPQIRLGLVLGRNAHAFTLGPLGAGMNIAPTVREGLQLAESFTRVHASYIDIDVQSSPHGMSMCIYYQEDTGTLEAFHTETAILMFQRYIENSIGQPLTDARYQLACPEPDDPRPYLEVIHGDIRFGADQNRIDIPRHWVDLPSPYFHAQMWEQAQTDLSRLLAEQVKSADNTFTRHIQALLRSSEPPLPDLAEVAARMFVSQRTLNRRLQTEQTSYRALKSDALAERAKAYLAQTEDTVESIAATLGYQDAANFRRAFRRHTGESPDSFRKKQQAKKWFIAHYRGRPHGSPRRSSQYPDSHRPFV